MQVRSAIRRFDSLNLYATIGGGMSVAKGPLGQRGMSWTMFLLIVLGAAIGIVIAGATTWMVNATSSVAFCSTACHSMSWAASAYERGPHFENSSGVRATCTDCHIPFESRPATPAQYVFGTLWTKGVDSSSDVIAEIRGTIADKAKWDEERPRLDKKVEEWFKATSSETCRGCHELDAFKKTSPARAIHAGLVKQEKVDCLQCHTGIAHVWPAAAAS
jgi:nitrate/TMAO reductase-like tetraheme cytochrome c subunit